ncbi:MAG: exosortase system-associated protein, TIGR04073 family [Geobacteraceae bacterium]|nr:exosortase system-associated protein, TIGR04073 family [Geobacteraceae bacterium]
MSIRLLKHLMVVVLSIALTSGIADATGYRNIENSSPQDIVEGMATKGVRGTANIVTGWVEIPKQIYVTGVETGWLRGAIIGSLKGVGMTVVRTVSGVGELFTFFVAYPGFYDPWIEPRFVWMKESSQKDSQF